MSQITFEYEKKQYTLEYTLKTAAMAERDGLSIEKLGDNPAVQIPILFHWSFYRHHKGITKEMTAKIYKEIKDKKGLIRALMDMYADAVNALIDDTDDDEEMGNANWTLT